MKTFFISVAFSLLAAGPSWGGDACQAPGPCTEVQTCGSADRCGRCGHAGPCEKHCKVVCETKEVKKHVWIVKCSDFCAPLPNCAGKCRGCCDSCNADCGPDCGCCEGCNAKCDPCAVEENKCIVPPKCGKVREKKTLEKKEVVCKVPSYKCVVVYCCPNCGAAECGAEQSAPKDAKPAAPAPSPERTTQEAPLPPIADASYLK